MTLPPRIEAKIERIPECGCWVWMGYAQPNGYGRAKPPHARQPGLAHRVVYAMVKGEIPEGMDLDHLCRVRACVNPDHLEPVTRFENLRRAGTIDRMIVGIARKRGDACAEGHAMTPENTYTYPNGQTTCRQCHAKLQRAYFEANKEKIYAQKRARRAAEKLEQAA